jgi:hypothetical protein
MTASTPSHLIAQARQGDTTAIAQLLNRALKHREITTRVSRTQNRLMIFADGDDTPEQASLLGVIRRGIQDLELDSIECIKVYGRKTGETTAGWQDKIVLQLAEADKPKFTGADVSGVLVSTKQGAITLFTSIRAIRIKKRTAIGFACVSGLAVVVAVTIMGVNLLQVRSVQAKTIHQVHALLLASDPSKAADVKVLEQNESKLKQARDLLRGIPNTPGSMYSQAQIELKKVRSQLDAVEQKITAEKSITITFDTATRQAVDAIASVRYQPKPLKTWQTAIDDLADAISQLETIPQGTFIAPQVKVKLEDYRKHNQGMKQGMQAEEKAMQALQTADSLALQAMSITESRYKFEASELQDAKALWQKAAAQLKKVPPKSDAHTGVNNRLRTYDGNMNKIADGLQALQQCQARNVNNSFLMDVCNSTFLSLDRPDTEVLSSN